MTKKTVIAIKQDNPEFNHRLRYVLDFIEQHPAADGSVQFVFDASDQAVVNIEYSSTPSQPLKEKFFFMPAQKLVFNTKIGEHQQWKANGYRFGEATVYSVENQQKKEGSLITDHQFNFDLFETIFFHISRFEEVHCPADWWDEWDMMEEKRQFLVREGLDKIPVVDHLVYWFLEALGLRPQMLQTAYNITHDIDVLRKYTTGYKLARASAKLLKNGRSWKRQFQLFKGWFQTRLQGHKDPYDSFDFLFSNAKGKEKIIYLMTGGLTKYDNHYHIEDQAVDGIIALAKKNGYQIGLHPSYATQTNEQQFLLEKQRLEKKLGESVQYSRQHFLHFSFNETLKILSNARIRNDSTLGYQNRYGFRCGTGFPFYLYDFEKEAGSPVMETPMIVMDVGLLRELNFDMQVVSKALDAFLKSNQFYTMITFNFHNTIFDPVEYDAEEMRRLYRKVNQQAEA